METVISNTKVSVSQFRDMMFDDDDEFYYEIIDGEMVRKSAPSPQHQRICRKIVVLLDHYINEKQLGEVLQSPIDVFLDDYNKPQPDLVFVSNEKKSMITNNGIMGVPDLIIEIISPTSIIRDRIEKKNLYERMGVQESWIVDPPHEEIEVHQLQNGRYEILSAATTLEGEFKSELFAGLSLNPGEIFS